MTKFHAIIKEIFNSLAYIKTVNEYTGLNLCSEPRIVRCDRKREMNKVQKKIWNEGNVGKSTL